MAKLWSGLVLLLHLVISQNEVLRVEAAICEAPSKLFHGACFLDSNCARICEKEGFLSGNCKGVLLKCICYKNCDVPPAGAPGGPPQEPPEGPPDNPPDTSYPHLPIPPPSGCSKPPGGCPNPPVGPSPPTGCPEPPSDPAPSPPTGCPHDPPGMPVPSPPTGCPSKS